MKMKPCSECSGEGRLFGEWIDGHWTLVPSPGGAIIPCYICEGTGSLPDEPVSNCLACGEPIEEGNWCTFHLPAADLWQALNHD